MIASRVMKSMLALSAALLLLSACAHQSESVATSEKSAIKSYGEPMPEGTALSLARHLPFDQFANDQQIKVSGRIGEVCQAKGCWMMLTDGTAASVRVKFGDHAFFIPKDTQGNAVVYGKFEVIEMSEKEAKHMAEDAGKDPSTVQGEQKEYRFIASSLQVQ
jgi:hypothetical protein